MNKLKYSIANKNPEPIKVFIEPWAEEYTLPPKSKLKILASYTHIDQFEIISGPGYITVWLWQGCTVEVFVDGKDETRPFFSTPAPV